jgi:predicted Rossmann fold nucleotide-binding protein DprA/Smf involved in DNA uptake
MVLARQMYKVVPTNLKEALEQNRLLIISTSQAVRQSRATALARNRYVCEMADEIMLVGAAEGNSLFVLTKQHNEKIVSF